MRRHQLRQDQLSQHTKELQPLQQGDTVQVQNQSGPHSNKWDTSGVIVEVLDYQSYIVKMDGSGRTSKRNRRFLRPIKPYKHALLPAEPNQGVLIPTEPHTLSTPSKSNSYYSGPTADKAGRPSTTPAEQEPAAADPRSDKVRMSDDESNESLTQARYNVLHDEFTSEQQQAVAKSPNIQLPYANTHVRQSRRVKFAPNRLIEQ